MSHSAHTLSDLYKSRDSACKRLTKLGGAHARRKFVMASQEAGIYIERTLGQAVRETAAFHVLVSSTPPPSINKLDFDGFGFRNVMTGILQHVRKERPIPECMAFGRGLDV